MPERDFRIRENELPEERGPYGSLIGGQIADREQRVQQCTVRSAVVGSGVPPVVHQHVEWRQRFDVMPPPVGNEQRVARVQLSLLRVAQGFGITRESIVITSRGCAASDVSAVAIG